MLDKMKVRSETSSDVMMWEALRCVKSGAGGISMIASSEEEGKMVLMSELVDVMMVCVAVEAVLEDET